MCILWVWDKFLGRKLADSFCLKALHCMEKCLSFHGLSVSVWHFSGQIVTNYTFIHFGYNTYMYISLQRLEIRQIDGF